MASERLGEIMRRLAVTLALVGVLLASGVGSSVAAVQPSTGTAATSCAAQTLNTGAFLGRVTLRAVVIGKVSCREAHRRVTAYFHKVAAGACGGQNNICGLLFPGGWTCSFFSGTESRETGGAVAGCIHHKARVRLYRSGPTNPPEFRAHVSAGFLGCSLSSVGVLCQAAPTSTGQSNPLVQIAKLQPDGETTNCSDA